MVRIFTDGSHRDGVVSWAFTAVLGKDVVREDYGVVGTEEYLRHMNIAGEVIAVINALQWASHETKRDLPIIIYHDYVGIGAWARGEWKAKTELSRRFKAYVHNLSHSRRLDFVHVKAHEGHIHNERADQLARRALDKPAPPEHLPDNGFLVHGIRDMEVCRVEAQTYAEALYQAQKIHTDQPVVIWHGTIPVRTLYTRDIPVYLKSYFRRST